MSLLFPRLISASRVVGLCGFAGLFAASGFAGPSDVADAAMNRDKAALRTLIQQKADVNAPQTDGATALHWAARWNDLEMADSLLQAGAKAQVSNRDGASPMYLATEGGNPAMVERLLKAGADANAPVLPNNVTPLMMAARSGNEATVSLLLSHGAKPNAKESLRETTALMWAVENDHAAVVKNLIDGGADVNAKTKTNEPPPTARRRPQTDDMQADSSFSTGGGGLNALIFAAREGALDAIQALVAAKADVNQTSNDGFSALLVSIQNGHYDVSRYLIEHGADVNLVNNKGWSPLYLTVKNRNIETGTLPVPTADGTLELIQLLLEKGANPNVQSKGVTEVRNSFRATWLPEAGATPFFRAAACGDLEVMKLLLKHGADPHMPTKDHTTPLMALSGVGYTEGFIHDHSVEQTMEAMNLLVGLGEEINAVNDAGLTPLHGAAHKNSLEQIQYLVDHGADLTAQDKGNTAFGQKIDGLTPLDWAQGVVIGVQAAIYHGEAVELISKLMTERGLPLKTVSRTLGGNAKVGTQK